MHDQSIQNEMLAALCLTNKAEKLFSFASPEREAELARISRRLAREGSGDPIAQVKNLVLLGQRRAMEEIHPGWILEQLQGESPRLILLLSRFLSSHKSEYLLSHLNFEERRSGRSSREVHPDLLAALRSLLQRKFKAAPSIRGGERFELEDIVRFKAEDLQTFFKDLGIEEVVSAFSGVSSSLTRPLLTRFSLTDATEIKRRLDRQKVVSVEKCRSAQRHLLSLSFSQIRPDRLLVEIGLSLFSRSIGVGHCDGMETICHRLPVGDGYRLKRLLEERKRKGGEADRLAREVVLKRLYVLATQGKIGRYWKDEREIEPTVIFEEGAA